MVFNHIDVLDFIALLCVCYLVYLYGRRLWRWSVKQLGWLIDCFFYKLIVKPVVLGTPGGILACYKLPVLRSKIPPDAIQFVDKNIGLIVLGLFIVPAFAGLEDFVKSKSKEYSDDLSSELLFLLLTALDAPVSQKMDRFFSELNSGANRKDPREVFARITSPEKQLAEITRSIHVFFEGWAKNFSEKKIDFTTTIFRMESGIGADVWSYFPQSQRPESDLIKDCESLAAYTANLKKMVIIPDIDKERKKRKKRISGYCVLESGSALSYPISTGHTKGEIPLVLRITANKPFFTDDHFDLYKEILEHFKKRLLIEYSLSELKNQSGVADE